jgi:hypothetical protein
MKAPFLTGLTTATALTGILATSGIANAAIFTTPLQTVVYQPTGNELNVPPPYNNQGFGRTTISNSPLSIQQFNSGLGTLLSVTINFSGEMAGDGGFESLDAQPSTVTAGFVGNLQLKLPDNTPLFNLNPASGQLVFQNVSAFDGGLNFDGPSGEMFQGLTAAAAGANTYNDPNFLQQFIGNGNLNFLFSATGSSQFTGPSNLVQFINTYAKSSVTVSYEYEVPDQPPTKVPEPAVTLGLGLVAGLGLLSQKKKNWKKI